MIEFERLEGPFGIPVYFQSLPPEVESASFRWLVFTGSADDLDLKAPGVYHWFEHVPSRGTVNYPGGYGDTELRLADSGGEAGAHTLPTHTAYYAHLPLSRWQPGLDVLTDMIACPLLREADVRSERRIIQEELTEWLSSASDRASYELPRTLWKGHPLGHHPLGTRATLQATDPALLRKAFARGYARSRVLLLVSGCLETSELLDEVARCAERLPQRRLTERRAPASYGSLPAWKSGRTSRRKIPLPGSVVYFLFPVPALEAGSGERERWLLLAELFESGGLGSPLHRLLREARGLVYSVSVDWAMYPDGGYWGFAAETSRGKVDEVIETFEQALAFPGLRSRDWYDYVLRAVSAAPAMRGLDPDAHTEVAEDRLSALGEIRGDRQHLEALNSVSRDELLEFLSRLGRETAHTIVFEGEA